MLVAGNKIKAKYVNFHKFLTSLEKCLFIVDLTLVLIKSNQFYDSYLKVLEDKLH